MKQLKRAQRFERRAERKVGRAEDIEGRAAARRERYTSDTGEVGKRADARATRMETRATGLRDRAQQYQNLSANIAPNLTPGSETGNYDPMSSQRPYQVSQDQWDAANPQNQPVPGQPTTPFQQYNPRAPYQGGPTMQQLATPGIEQVLSNYYVGGGPTGQRLEDMINTEYGQIEGRTTNRFADMFGKYIDVANREADRQAGQIGESLGARGALYSSANLGQQANMRRQTAQDIGLKAQEYMTGLEQQRQNAWQQVQGAQAGVATAELGSREAAMGRGWQDFLRTSDIPPEFGAGQQWASSRPGKPNYARY